MQMRLSTPGILFASIVAVCIGAAAALFLVPQQRTEPVALSLPALPRANASTALINPALIYQERADGVVTLDAVFGNDAIGGSGFVVDHDGYILTSAHVVYDFKHGGVPASDVFVEFASNDRVSAEIIGYDPFSDIAVVKVDPDDVELHPVPLGDSDKVIVGQPVAAIGSPFGNEGSLSTGLVSAAHRSIPAVISRYDIVDAIQTDAAINHGNSGGPLFDARGTVIGISQQIRTTDGQGAGVAFAIPINTGKRALAQIKKTGTVRYAHLGLTTKSVTPQMVRTFDLTVQRGVLVQSMKEGGAAARAGLLSGSDETVFQGELIRLGDQIVSIAGQPVRTEEDIARLVSRIDVGDSLRIEFYRAGQRRSVIAVAGEREL